MFLSRENVMSVSFSPCGGRIASASRDHTIKVWEASTGTCQWTLRGHSKDNPECTCKHDAGKYGRDYEANPECPVTVDAGKYGVRSVSFSPKDNVIAAGCSNGKIHLVDAVAGEVKSSLSGHDARVLSVCFSPDGKKIASGARDKTVRIWDAATGAPVGSPLTGHSERVNFVVFSPNGKVIASCSGEGYNRDNSVRLWDAATGAAIGSPLRGHRYDPSPCMPSFVNLN